MKEGASHSAPVTKQPGKSNTPAPANDHFFKSTGAQPKLMVGASDDVLEKQADATADRIVNKKNNPAIDKEQPTGPVIQKKDKEEEVKARETPEKKIQKKSEGGGGGAHAASPSVQSALGASKGSGHSLPDSTRQSMENGFGTDFSGVRIHSDSQAAQMNEELGAQAFTHGNDIYFNEGKYNPGSSEGDHLLAHELTHTIQQGDGIQRKTDTPDIQRAPNNKKTDPKAPINLDNLITDILGPKYMIIFKDTQEKHVLDITAQELTVPGLLLPDFKKRNAPKFKLPIYSTKEDRKKLNTQQTDNWRNSVSSAVNAAVADFVTKAYKSKKKDDKDDDKKPPGEPELYFLRLSKDHKFNIIGTMAEIQAQFLIPKWNRDGEINSHQVDHIVEMQLGGTDQLTNQPDNYELTDTKANLSSGSTIKNERYRRVLNSLALFREVEVAKPGTFPNIPKDDTVINGYITIFQKVEDWKLPYTGKGNMYWTHAEILAGKHIHHVEKIPDNEAKNLKGSAKELLIYVGSPSGVSRKLPVPIGKKQDFMAGLDCIGIEKTGDGDDYTSIKFQLTDKFSKRLPKDTEMPFDLVRIRPFTYYIKTTRQFNKNMFTKFEGMSPITVNKFDLDDVLGLVVEGTITADLPFLKGLVVDFYVAGGDLTFSTTIGLDILKKNFPKLFNITRASLTLSYTLTKNVLALTGNVAFEVEKLGKGEIVASVSNKGFLVSGDFIFDKSILDGKIHVEYSSENGWSISGMAKIAAGKLKGVKEGTVNFKYAKGVIDVSGSATLTVPGIEKITIASTIGEDGNFIVAATAELKPMPGIKSGTVKVIITQKKGEELKLGAEGKVVPDFPAVPEMKPEINFSYYDGLFDVRVKVDYKKGRFTGEMELGITNRAVDEKGQVQGEPVEGNLVVFGYGQLTVELFEGAKGTVKVRVTPDKQVMVAGQILLENLRPFGNGYNFKKPLAHFPKVEIPLIGIPGMSISAFIEGGVDFTFNWDPLVLKLLNINFPEVNINELDKAQLEIKADVGSIATAELILWIDAGLKARVLIATLSGSIGGEAGIGVKAEAGGKLDAGWDMEKGLKFKQALIYLHVTPYALFRLKGKISVDLDLWIASVNLYYKEWILANKNISLDGLALNIDFPLTFNEDNSVNLPPYEKMNVQRPDLEGEKGKELMDSALNGDAKKEEEAKKQEIRNTIRSDLRNSTNDEDFSPTKYQKEMVKKYGKSPELKEFVLSTIAEESRNLEYERFEGFKNLIRTSPEPLNVKMMKVDFMTTWVYGEIRQPDIDSFKNELKAAEEEKRLALTSTKNTPV